MKKIEINRIKFLKAAFYIHILKCPCLVRKIRLGKLGKSAYKNNRLHCTTAT